MEETHREVLDASTTEPSTNSMIVEQTSPSPSVCVVCGDHARSPFFGAVVCNSCKVFFRRNAQTQPSPLKCNSGDHCEINVKTRRVCPSCRLAKCFASGMSVEMIRSSWTVQKNRPRKKRSKTNSKSTALARLPEINQPVQIRTLNLVQNDLSTLSTDQWNHLSNLVHCFDEYSGLSFTQNFIDEQNTLPPKLRFKHTTVNVFFKSMMSKVQLVFEKNRDSLSLSLHDRTILLRSTVEDTTNIGGAFLLQQTELLDRPAFSQSAELIFGPAAVAFTKRLIDQLDPDLIFLKLLLGTIAFCISNYTVYGHTPFSHLTDIKPILRIQDTYTELVWRYLLYKHAYRDAVLCFLNFVRCLFLANASVVESHEAREFTDIIDSVVQSTEEKLTLKE